MHCHKQTYSNVKMKFQNCFFFNQKTHLQLEMTVKSTVIYFQLILLVPHLTQYLCPVTIGGTCVLDFLLKFHAAVSLLYVFISELQVGWVSLIVIPQYLRRAERTEKAWVNSTIFWQHTLAAMVKQHADL